MKTLPPWGVILLHLGACVEAVEWAGRRPVSMATIRACPNREWVSWLRARLKVHADAPWSEWKAALVRRLSGDGSGYGSGDGYGYGYGDGSGDGYGYGYGDGSGDGSGADVVRAR